MLWYICVRHYCVKPVGISLLISLTWEQKAHVMRFRHLDITCKFLTTVKAFHFRYVNSATFFSILKSLSFLGMLANPNIRVWLQIALPLQKPPRPESIYADFFPPSLYPFFPPILQYLIPYCVPVTQYSSEILRCSPCAHRVYFWYRNGKTKWLGFIVMKVMKKVSTEYFRSTQKRYLSWTLESEVASKLTPKD